MGKVNAYAAMADMLGVVAVGEHKADGVRAWPNPCADELYVRLDDSVGAVRYTVLDVVGRVIDSGPLTKGTVRISSRSWNSGVYQLRMEGASTIALRIVKP